MRGLWSIAVAAAASPLAAPWHAIGLLELLFGPFESTAMSTSTADANEITQPIPVRAIDTVLEHYYERARVREEHAIHAAVLNGYGAAAHDAQTKGRTDLAARYRKQAIELDKLAAIDLRATASRAK